ncbi:MAG: redoxin domain-containing protein [Desulfobacterales bacterium]|nr:redoxin domain-containing protein [Desulfobacterales bacterium]
MSSLVLLLLSYTFAFASALPPPKEGELLPEIVLPAPQDADGQRYLGVSGSQTFSVFDIQAEVVIIQIFSMYCPYCQADAPFVNELYHQIQKSPQIKDKIKLLGIGVGNSRFEVDFFRKKYDVAFPLFPDDKFVIHKQMGEVRTPYFIGIRKHPDGSWKVFYSKLGGVKNADDFLKTIRKLSGLN